VFSHSQGLGRVKTQARVASGEFHFSHFIDV
jgi:hypothetical protein